MLAPSPRGPNFRSSAERLRFPSLFRNKDPSFRPWWRQGQAPRRSAAAVWCCQCFGTVLQERMLNISHVIYNALNSMSIYYIYILHYIEFYVYTVIYILICIYDGLSKCLPVWLVNRNSLRAASCLVFKTMTYLNSLKTMHCIIQYCIFHVWNRSKNLQEMLTHVYIEWVPLLVVELEDSLICCRACRCLCCHCFWGTERIN